MFGMKFCSLFGMKLKGNELKINLKECQNQSVKFVHERHVTASIHQIAVVVLVLVCVHL